MSNVKFALALFLSAWISPILAASATGTVSFQGSLMGESCGMSLNQSQVSASCYQNGQTIVLPVSLRSGSQPLAGIGTTNVRWLDSRQAKGIVTINYR